MARPGAAALCGGGYAGAEAEPADVPEGVSDGVAAPAPCGNDNAENASPSYGLLPAESWGAGVAEAMGMSGDGCDADWMVADPRNSSADDGYDANWMVADPRNTNAVVDSGGVALAESGCGGGGGIGRFAGGVEGEYVSRGPKELRQLDVSRWPDGEFRGWFRVWLLWMDL